MDGKELEFDSIRGIPDFKCRRLLEQRIFFGHQSVGYNVIDGIRDVMQDNPQIKLNIDETVNVESLHQPVFSHARVGNNEDPNSKCEAFASLIKREFGKALDFALLKFCYVDITSASDVGSIFSTYSKMVFTLKGLNSGLKVIHVTVPLRAVQDGPRAWVKRAIKEPVGGYADNIKRAEYNDRMRIEYGGKEPLFDLARLESTFADGGRHTFSAGGKAYEALVPAYTDDGGHRNQKGRRWVAEHFLVFLANLSPR
jgi:hypothetical protein